MSTLLNPRESKHKCDHTEKTEMAVILPVEQETLRRIFEATSNDESAWKRAVGEFFDALMESLPMIALSMATDLPLLLHGRVFEDFAKTRDAIRLVWETHEGCLFLETLAEERREQNYSFHPVTCDYIKATLERIEDVLQAEADADLAEAVAVAVAEPTTIAATVAAVAAVAELATITVAEPTAAVTTAAEPATHYDYMFGNELGFAPGSVRLGSTTWHSSAWHSDSDFPIRNWSPFLWSPATFNPDAVVPSGYIHANAVNVELVD